jgi:hypothetical protein
MVRVYSGERPFEFSPPEYLIVRLPRGPEEPFVVARADRNPPRVLVSTRTEQEGPNLRGGELPLILNSQDSSVPEARKPQPSWRDIAVSLLVENKDVSAMTLGIADRGISCDGPGNSLVRWKLIDGDWRGVDVGPIVTPPGKWSVFLNTLETIGNATVCSAWFDVSYWATGGWVLLKRVEVQFDDATEAPELPLG